jgi:tetratricopeptide (TPR) repeat protein
VTDYQGLDELARAVRLQRRRGDAAATRRRAEDAGEAYRSALSLADDALQRLPLPPAGEAAAIRALDRRTAEEAAEWFGVRGGILRRLGSLEDQEAQLREALRSYRAGAVYESEHDLPNTYNRGNAIKLALIAGEDTVEGCAGQLAALRDAVEFRSTVDVRAADDAWIWADLGDALLLLGEERGALEAYRVFAAKARTDSPQSAFAMMHEVVGALRRHQDPQAEQIAASLNQVQSMTLGG